MANYYFEVVFYNAKYKQMYIINKKPQGQQCEQQIYITQIYDNHKRSAHIVIKLQQWNMALEYK